ncbi:SymE family type I addiction module toxin [Sphingobacterium detergens]|uniref:Type I toxin-antitoxin system toxin SymE n=1 Tax=Sphingobacterium detergens TaxID=1145106 RepID=A0A420AMB3_SPHD1|nr:SymE family type I addiction module toxin [Sphingobacterium detergens]RKE45592.1 type I toxin-antitoxin system toxin SymE [Sphingobacterium detergens]
MRTLKKQISTRPEVRSLKIQPTIKFNRWCQTRVPVIRLSSLWLEKLGFTPEKRVSVMTMDKLLFIKLEE